MSDKSNSHDADRVNESTKDAKGAKSDSKSEDMNAAMADIADLNGKADQAGNTELEKAKEEAEKYKNELLYLKAEFDTYRRHAAKDRAEARKFGAESLVRDLLSVIDNFERAMQVKITAENYKTFAQGVEMTASELKNVLAKNDVVEVPAQGAFDPSVHEAVGAEPSKEIPPGHILRVHQRAYKLHDRVIRPAQVVVAKEG